MSGRRCVLHVDGSGDRTPSSDLEAAGFEVHTTATVANALDRLATESVDCVVASPPLAEEDGLGLLRRVRARDPRLPVVLHPADGSEALASEAIGAGVTDYVPRSGESGERLVEAVASAITAAPNRPVERGFDLIRTVQSALVGARTAGEIDDGVCEALVDTEPYVFAWIGEYDEDGGQVTPRAFAGAEASYLDTIEITADESQAGHSD